jgi:hypothetical protein
MLTHPNPAGFSMVEDSISRPQSAFEQYTGLRVAEKMLDVLEHANRERLATVLTVQRGGPPGTISEQDPSRWLLSGALLNRIEESLMAVATHSNAGNLDEGVSATIPYDNAMQDDATQDNATQDPMKVPSSAETHWPDAARRALAPLAEQYEAIRREPYSDERTNKLIAVRNAMMDDAAKLTGQEATDLFRMGSPGYRLAALVVAEVAGDAECVMFVRDALQRPRSGFEAFHAVWAAGAILPRVRVEAQNDLVELAEHAMATEQIEPASLEMHVPELLARINKLEE